MKIKLYSLLHNDIQRWYTLDYPGDSVSEGEALDILDQAKKKFKIAGKTFIMITSDDVFFITKMEKKWKSYKLQKGYVTHAGSNEVGDQETDSEPELKDNPEFLDVIPSVLVSRAETNFRGEED